MKRVFLLISAVASSSIPQSESGLLVTTDHRPNSLLMSLMKKPRKLLDVEKLDEDDLERIMMDPESLIDNLQENSPFLSSSPMGDFSVESNDAILERQGLPHEEAPSDWWSQGWT